MNNYELEVKLAAKDARIAALEMDIEGLRIVSEGLAWAKQRNEELEAENAAFRKELERQRQGLQTILELRKIAGTDRYGALTRDEIEDVIMGIDATLERQAKPINGRAAIDAARKAER